MENLRVKELQVSGLSGGERPHEVDPPSELGTPAATETMSTEWTDEKHSMYLKSMEASFVNQLYNSMDTRGRHKGNLSHIKSSRQPQFNSRAASGQFKVLRGGSWHKINFGRGEAEVNKSDQPCGDLLANPWILHFRSTCKPKDVDSPILQEQAAAICEEVDSSLKKEITSAPATCSKQFNRCQTKTSLMKISKRKRPLLHAILRGRKLLYFKPQVTIRLFHSESLLILKIDNQELYFCSFMKGDCVKESGWIVWLPSNIVMTLVTKF